MRYDDIHDEHIVINAEIEIEILYDDIHDEHINEPHDLSDQFDLSLAVTVNQLPLLIAQIAIDCGFSPQELVDFMKKGDRCG